MRKLLLYLLTFGFVSFTYPQKSIRDYKQLADKAILQYFDTSLIKKINCYYFSICSSTNSCQEFLYEKDNRKRLNFSSISFKYHFFSKDLNQLLWFSISINKAQTHIDYSTLLAKIPLCIRSLLNCNYISSDSAKKIAIHDSILYPRYLSAYLAKSKRDQNFPI